MNDGQRKYPVNIFVLHHSVGPVFANTPDITIQDWFSSVGKARGYQNGAINPSHEHPGRPGQLTYSMAQFAGAPDSTNKYNYRLIDLIKRPWQNVAWHAGDWEVNVHSVGLENCGDFTNKLLEERQLMCIADFIRPIDKELVDGGNPNGMAIMLHQEIFNTACPARIKEQRDTLVDMINNPDKWNRKLWPPAPVVTTKEIVETKTIAFTSKTVEDPTLAKGTIALRTTGVNGVRKVTYLVTYSDGKETSRIVKSDVVTKQPVEQVTAIGTYVPPTAPPTAPHDPTDGENAYTWIQRIAKYIMEQLSKFVYKK